MRPGIHLSNCSPITDADWDCAMRWKPLSALLAMNNIVESNEGCDRLVQLWEQCGRPLLVLRKYFEPSCGPKPNWWGIHAVESVAMAKRCMARGVPLEKLALKPFNEPNMPRWACWEGFGDKPADIELYNIALKTFIQVAKNELPGILIGGPHLTVGNRDVRFPSDPEDRYYYGPNSLCQEALDMLDLHFVHCYGFRRGQFASPYHGLRFTKYEEFFSKNVQGRPIYIVEGAYGVQWENGNSIDPAHNNVRGEDTAAYLELLKQHPQIKGITLWIAGDQGWQEHRHSDAASPDTHRPVVGYVERFVAGEPQVDPNPNPNPNPDPEPEPGEIPELELRTYDNRELRGQMAHDYMRLEYGSAITRYPGSVYPEPLEGDLVWRIVRIEEAEGPNIVKCRTKDGSVATFAFRWDGGPESFEGEWYARGDKRTGTEVDFVLGPDSIAFPPHGGGHALWVLDQPSDLADRWGWKPMTNHRSLYITFDAIPYKEEGMPDETDYPGAVWKGPAAQGNFKTGRPSAIQFIVLHGTGKGANVPCDAPLALYAVNWFKDPASGVSAHYVIPRVGGVWQVVREDDTAFHAGSYTHNCASIGIEGEHCGCPDHPWAQPVIDTMIAMLKHLVSKYSVPKENILLHKWIVDTACPVGLPLEEILEEVFGVPDEPSVNEILTLVYGPIWTDQWDGMNFARENSKFFPIFFAEQFQGSGHIGTTRVDWQLTPDFLIYWINPPPWNKDTRRVLRWPPDLG